MVSAFLVSLFQKLASAARQLVNAVVVGGLRDEKRGPSIKIDT